MTDDDGRTRVPPFPSEYRASSLLMHVTSLPSLYGIGDLGSPAFSWIDRLHHAGVGTGERSNPEADGRLAS
jgi:4-alpha-glucanotransferase